MKKILTFFVILGLFIPFLPLNVKADTDLPAVDVMITYLFNDDGPPAGMIITMLEDQAFGSTINPTPMNPASLSFQFWIINGVVRLELPENNTFYVTSSDMYLTAVYSPNDENVVLFIDSNDKVIDLMFLADGEVASTAVTLPDKPGLQISTPAWKNIETGSTDLTIFDDSIYKLQYDSISADTYNLNLDGTLEGSYAHNEVVTLTALASNGINDFSHWEENGVVLSRDLEYSFTMLGERNITKVYLETPLSDTGLVNISPNLEIRDGYQTYLGQFYIPSGFDLVESGFLIHEDNTIDLTLETPGVTIAKSSTFNPSTNEYMTSFSLGSHMNARAYLVYSDGVNPVYVYSETSNRYLQSLLYSEDFETIGTWSSYLLDGTKALGGINWTLNEVLNNSDSSDLYSSIVDIHGTEMLRLKGSDTAYMYMDDYVPYIDAISFDAKYYNASNSAAVMKVWKEIEGSTWVEVDELTLTDSYMPYIFSIKEKNVRIKITVDTASANLDNLNIYTLDEASENIVTFNDEGSLYSLPAFPDGSVLRPIDPQKEGYSFNGWYLEDTFVTLFDFDNDTISEDTTLYAKYTINQYTVTFDSNGGSAVASITDDYGTPQTAPADPTKDGYTFDDWYQDSGLTTPVVDYSIPSSDVTIYAGWDIVTYNITYNLDSGTNNPSNPDTYTIENTPINLENPTKDGFTFDGWFTDSGFVTPISAIAEGSFGDYVLYAKFTEPAGPSYTVSFDTNEGSVVLPQTVAEDDYADVPTNPTKDGYLFDGWFTDDGNFTNEFNFGSDAITADITLYAKWLQWSTDDFSDYPVTGSSYVSGTFTGSVTNIVWNYNVARGDQTIDEESVTLKDGTASLEATIPNGISNFRIELKKAFSTDTGIELYINDFLIATSEKSTGDLVIFEVFDIDTTGQFTIKLVPTDAQTIIDNLSWTPYGPVTGYSPVIENTSDSTITEGDTYNPLTGVTSSDVEDGDLTGSISYVVRDNSNNIVPDPVDFSTLSFGSYSITYSVTDSNSNTLEVSITLTVLEDSPSVVYSNDLFISEYIEGSSNNKAIEIYNNTGSPIDLSNYTIRVYANGATTFTSITLSGSLAHGAAFVLANPSSNTTILALADLTSASLNHNGNDVIALAKAGTNIDVVGTIGSSADFAKDKTLIRNSDVSDGTTTYDSLEWTVEVIDYTDDLGSHTVGE